MHDVQNPRNAQEAIAQANRLSRAKEIIEQGYTFSFDELTNTVAVCKPGRLAASYWIVDGECDCPDALKGNYCKHRQAWKLLQDEQADDAAMWEARCKEYDEQEGWADVSNERLKRMRNLLLAELLDAENRAAALNAEPFCKPSAVRSWANKADRCKKALRQFDETLTKVSTGLLTL